MSAFFQLTPEKFMHALRFSPLKLKKEQSTSAEQICEVLIDRCRLPILNSSEMEHNPHVVPCTIVGQVTTQETVVGQGRQSQPSKCTSILGIL